MTIPRESGIRAYYGSELRRLRVSAGMTQDVLGDRTAYSSAYVSHVETAKRIPSLKFSEKCDEMFETDSLVRLWSLISKDSYPVWFRPWLDMEQEARGAH